MSSIDIKSIRAIGAKTPDLDIEIPEHEFIDERMKDGGGINRKDLLTEFESLYRNRLNLERMVEGHQFYMDDKTELFYRAFIVAVTEQRHAIHRALKNVKKVAVAGPFVIGMQVSDGTVQFSKRPYKHPTLDKARKEALRLQGPNGQGLTIFGAIEHIGRVSRDWQLSPDQVVVPEAFVRKRTLGRVLHEFADIQKSGHPLVKAPMAPCSFFMSPEGSATLTYNCGETIKLDSYEDLAKFVDIWITNHREATALRRHNNYKGITHYGIEVSEHLFCHDAKNGKQTLVQYVEDIPNIDWVQERIKEIDDFKRLAIAENSLVGELNSGACKVIATIVGISEESLGRYFPKWIYGGNNKQQEA